MKRMDSDDKAFMLLGLGLFTLIGVGIMVGGAVEIFGCAT